MATGTQPTSHDTPGCPYAVGEVHPVGVITGKISWFTGTDTASGEDPSTVSGIAYYNEKSLGGYWVIMMPNQNLALIQQIDIGPCPNTGRKFDFSQASLEPLGYTTSNFPTDSTVLGVYIGTRKWSPEYIVNALTQIGASKGQIQAVLQQADGGNLADVSDGTAGGGIVVDGTAGASNASDVVTPLGDPESPSNSTAQGVNNVPNIIQSGASGALSWISGHLLTLLKLVGGLVIVLMGIYFLVKG